MAPSSDRDDGHMRHGRDPLWSNTFFADTYRPRITIDLIKLAAHTARAKKPNCTTEKSGIGAAEIRWASEHRPRQYRNVIIIVVRGRGCGEKYERVVPTYHLSNLRLRHFLIHFAQLYKGAFVSRDTVDTSTKKFKEILPREKMCAI